MYLRGANDWFSDAVALGNAHLLRQEDLLGRNFDAEIASCDHYAVGRLQNLIKPAARPHSASTAVAAHLPKDRNCIKKAPAFW